MNKRLLCGFLCFLLLLAPFGALGETDEAAMKSAMRDYADRWTDYLMENGLDAISLGLDTINDAPVFYVAYHSEQDSDARFGNDLLLIYSPYDAYWLVYVTGKDVVKPLQNVYIYADRQAFKADDIYESWDQGDYWLFSLSEEAWVAAAFCQNTVFQFETESGVAYFTLFPAEGERSNSNQMVDVAVYLARNLPYYCQEDSGAYLSPDLLPQSADAPTATPTPSPTPTAPPTPTPAAVSWPAAKPMYLVRPKDGYAECKFVGSDRIAVMIELKNISQRTIVAYTFCYSIESPYDKNTKMLTQRITQTFAAGGQKYSGYLYITLNGASNVHVGIQEVEFSDGTVVHYDLADIQFTNWHLQ